MEEVKSKSIYYKVSINLGPFRIYNNSRVYEIAQGKSTILPGIKYSLITLCLGWWGFSGFRALRFFKSIRNSLEALHINFTGGEDISKIVDEYDFDEKTNYIWNNLLRKTTEKISKEDVEIILEIQNEYINLDRDQFTDENINFIIINLGKLDIHRINQEEIGDVFDAIRIYNARIE